MKHRTHPRQRPAGHLWLIVGAAVAAALLAATPGPHAGEDDPLAALSERLEGMTPGEQVAYLDSLLDAGWENARIYFFKGNAYYSASQPDSAIAAFARAVEIDEDYGKAYVNMGIVYDSQRKHGEARRAYTRAIQINPDDALAHCHLGYNYYAGGDHATAMDYYEKALEIDPNNAQAHYNLGLAFANAKIFEEALLEWRKVTELDPDGALGKMAAENVELIQKYMELEN